MMESVLLNRSKLVLWKLDCLGGNPALPPPGSVVEGKLPNFCVSSFLL